MDSEDTESALRERYGAAAAVLRLGEHEPFAGVALHLTGHSKAGTVEGYIRPPQAEQLADPQACSQGQGEQALEPLASGGGQQRARLFGIEGCDLVGVDLRRVNRVGGVAGDEVEPYGLIECPMQYRVREAYGRRCQSVAELLGVEGLD